MNIRPIISTRQTILKTYGDKILAFVKDKTQLDSLHQYEFDAIILLHTHLISNIRQDDQLYLKPLFLMGKKHHLTDGAFDEHNPYQQFHKIEQLEKSTRAFNHLSLPQNEDKILVKLLRFLLSRKKQLSPIRDRHSSIGYYYHLLEDLSTEHNQLQLLRIMKSYVQKGYFQAVVRDKVNICQDCEGSYLNFSECCTKCHSLDLKTENLIHHFRCAYIGPESDFKKNDRLECPKCDKILKHIGIDYDKPSEVHTCNSCNHTTQETTMMAKCIDCGKDNELDQLLTHSIYEYKLTAKGKDRALQVQHTPIVALKNDSTENQFCLPSSVFDILSKHELQKKKVYQNSIYQLDIQVSPQIMNKLNVHLQTSLLEELAGIIQPYLKTHDLLTRMTEGGIKILLIDYEDNLAKETQEVVAYNLDKMLRDNSWTNEKAITTTLKVAAI